MAPAPRRPSWPSTAPPSRRACWKASCSATRRAPLPRPTAAASASSSSARSASCCSTRSCGYSWPGNIRELQSVLKQALLQTRGAVLLPAFLPEPLGGAGVVAAPAPPAAEPGLEKFVIRQRVGSDVRDLYAETHRQVD